MSSTAHTQVSPPTLEQQAPAQDQEDIESESATTTASTGSKRKRGSEFRFYAVKAGRKPGIYHSWTDCVAQVEGFKNATHKSFTSLTEAEAYMSESSSSKSGKPQSYYGVQNGRVPGVYTDWPSAQKQITGWTKPKYKKFATKAEAEAFVKAGKADGEAVPGVTIEPNGSTEAIAGVEDGLTAEGSAPPAKKQKKANGTPAEQPPDGTIDQEPPEPGTGPLPPDAEDGFDRRILLNAKTGKVEYKTEAQLNATKLQPTGDIKSGMLNIYTDGSSLGNGAQGAVAGVGVFFGPGDDRNISESLTGPRQTNQRAELTAIQRALDIAPLDRDVTIFSDSNYAINCATVWFAKWRTNNWQTAARKPVENKDLVEAIVNRIDERNRCRVRTEFRWLKGHADDPGNVAADHLAVQGAREARAGGG